MKRILTAMFGGALLLSASGAFGQAAPPRDTGIVGSDTLQGIMDDLIVDLGTDLLFMTEYHGLGSSIGERQLEGRAIAGDPGCSDVNGCEEISPMSDQMGANICDDDPEGGPNVTAEGLAICRDGIVIMSDNASLGNYGESAAACDAYAGLANTDNTGNVFPDHGVGLLRNSGVIDLDPPGPGPEDYGIGDNDADPTNDWKDVIRIVYTGCDNDDGTCAASTDRVTRCGSELRQKVVGNWGNLFQGVDCGAPGNSCPNGLRQAYRRDDGSGTTRVFLQLIGVANSPGSNLANRGRIMRVPAIAAEALPATNSFCDGGQVEGFFPTGFTGACPGPGCVPVLTGGDPIRPLCAEEDDLCAWDGRLGLVRPIRSAQRLLPPLDTDPQSGFPDHQCSRAKFRRVQFINTAFPVCPDGKAPSGGRCFLPVYENTSTGFQTFNCMNRRISIPATPAYPTGSVDGRSYNVVMREPSGTVHWVTNATNPPPGQAGTMPQIATWRHNMMAFMETGLAGVNGGPIPAANYRCTDVDATRNIGCFVSQTTCAIGWAGREGAFNTASNHHLGQEPVQIDTAAPSNAEIGGFTYPFARDLYVNAIHGFENMTADCMARNGGVNTDWCQDQRLIADAFYNLGAPGNPVADICEGRGFIPLPAAVCRGATGSAGCGAPTVQPLSACLPN